MSYLFYLLRHWLKAEKQEKKKRKKEHFLEKQEREVPQRLLQEMKVFPFTAQSLQAIKGSNCNLLHFDKPHISVGV